MKDILARNGSTFFHDTEDVAQGHTLDRRYRQIIRKEKKMKEELPALRKELIEH